VVDGAPAPDEAEAVTRLRSVCGALPETREEAAWVGTRWRIRTRTFAHVLTIERGWPPAYANAAAELGPCTVLMFRTDEPPLAFTQSDDRFFTTPWRPDELGCKLRGRIDWAEVGELVVGSYCLLAPRKLAAMVERGR
jgi:hypothetical protein